MAMKFEKKGNGTYALDVLRCVCTHPQIYTKKGMKKLAKGEILELLFDKHSSAESITAMCEASGGVNDIIEKKKDGSTFTFRIKKN